MFEVKISSPQLKRLQKRLASGKLREITRGELEELGDASIKDAKHRQDTATNPNGKAWKQTLDGRKPFAGHDFKFTKAVVSPNTVRVGTDDVRAIFSHRARSATVPTGFTLKSPAIVPLSRAIAQRKNAAGGWRYMPAFKIKLKTAGGEATFLAERVKGQRRLNLLGIFKTKLKFYRRQMLGEGPNLRAAGERLALKIATKAVFG